jgi:alkaline phosphatase
MNRRLFLKNGSAFTLGGAILAPLGLKANNLELNEINRNKKAKNIIMLVSDGMSSGALNMADLYLRRTLGKGSNWLSYYEQKKVSRGLMDMGSANSMITDSAAASSSWGSGFRVKNGALNISPDGQELKPIWKKFKEAGKKAGCVTTVPITHATPAGFLANSKSRNSQEDIAEKYLENDYDVLMGGGLKYFDAGLRKDKKDILKAYSDKNYQVIKTKQALRNVDLSKKVLGVFAEDALPYTLDRNSDQNLQTVSPTLAEMTLKAIDLMKSHDKGFVLQVEAGRVDWAAHANDIGGLLYDQVAFDEALGVAMRFAEQDQNTLVIYCTDHGNANPGLLYGKEADKNFDNIANFKRTNDSLLNSFKPDVTENELKDQFKSNQNLELNDEEVKKIIAYYKGLSPDEDGTYNYKKLPFATLSQIQKSKTSVGWIGTEHSADYVEIAMFGPGSEQHIPFIKNTDLHYFMLKAAEIQNK